MRAQDFLVDVLVVHYRTVPALRRLLSSLEFHEKVFFRYGVHVANNGPPDPMLNAWALQGRIHLYQSPTNEGFARGINRLIRATRAPYLMLINPDAWLVSPVMGRMCAFMESHRRVGILGPRVLNEDGSFQGSARAFPNFSTVFFGRSSVWTRLFPTNRGSCRNVLDRVLSERASFSPVDWVSGACMFVRRDAVGQVGGLDERFFLYWEDADWCWRMWRHGWQVVYWPEVTVFHRGGGSRGHNSLGALVAFHRSALRYYTKYRHQRWSWADGAVGGLLGLRLMGLLTVGVFRQVVGVPRTRGILRREKTS